MRVFRYVRSLVLLLLPALLLAGCQSNLGGGLGGEQSLVMRVENGGARDVPVVLSVKDAAGASLFEDSFAALKDSVTERTMEAAEFEEYNVRAVFTVEGRTSELTATVVPDNCLNVARITVTFPVDATGTLQAGPTATNC